VKMIEKRSISSPIIIIGMERSGTTLLYSILSNHPDLYWLSQLDSILPRLPAFSSAVRKVVHSIFDQSYIARPGTVSESKGVISPSECLPYWRNIFGWGNEAKYRIDNDYFTDQDLSDELSKDIRNDMIKRLKVLNKMRLLFKQPGFSLKIRFFHKLFPDAYFIHILRHPYNNLTSLVDAKRKTGEKFWGTKVPGWREMIKASHAEQAVFQIRNVLDIIEKDVKRVDIINDQYIIIKYENLICQPKKTIDHLLDFCELGKSNKVYSVLSGIVKVGSNYDPDIDLSSGVKQILDQICEKYEYKPHSLRS